MLLHIRTVNNLFVRLPGERSSRQVRSRLAFALKRTIGSHERIVLCVALTVEGKHKLWSKD